MKRCDKCGNKMRYEIGVANTETGMMEVWCIICLYEYGQNRGRL